MNQNALHADRQNDALKRKRHRRRFVVLGFLLICSAWFLMLQPVARKFQLVSACTAADRLLVVVAGPPGMEGGSKKLTRLTVEIMGRDKVDGFFEKLKLAPSIPCAGCRCLETISIEFADSNRTLARLDFLPDGGLRWAHGWWTGDSDLTTRSDANLRLWIDHEGGEALRSARTKANMLWDQFRHEMKAEMEADERTTTQPAEATSRPSRQTRGLNGADGAK